MRETVESSPEWTDLYLGTRQGTHEYVVARAGKDPHIPEGMEMFDMNVSTYWDPIQIEHLDDSKRNYHKLYDTMPDDEPNKDVRERQIEADLMTLDELGGEKFEFDEVMQVKAGFVPERPTDASIDAYKATIDDIMMRLYGYGYSRANLDRYLQEHGLQTEKAVVMALYEGMHLARVINSLYYPLPGHPVNVHPVSKPDEMWSGWFTTDNWGRFNLWANVHPNKGWTKGRVLGWSFHEIDHNIRLGLLNRAIRRGEISRADGLTSMTSTENPALEITPANSETRIVKLGETEEEKLELRLSALLDRIFNKVIAQAAIDMNKDVDPAKVLAKAEEDLQLERVARIAAAIGPTATHPIARVVVPAYHHVHQVAQLLVLCQDDKKIKKVMDRIIAIPPSLEAGQRIIEEEFPVAA